MKKLSKSVSILLAVVFMLSVFPVSALPVSPALDIIAKSYGMTKVSLVCRDVYFEAADFDFASGLDKVKSVSIESLPDLNHGTLMLGNIVLTEGQSISRKNLSNIRFVPRTDAACEASFTFSADTGSKSAYTCMIYMLESENTSPSAADVNVNTYSDIPVYGSMKAADPERDTLTYAVLSKPSHGAVNITDKNAGSFSYVPEKGYTGKDSFTYTAVDKYGNVSDTATVNLEVNERETNIVFSDLDGHFAHFAAIKTASDGVMSFYQDNGVYTFAPNDPISRAEFCTALLKSAGFTGFKANGTTVYADDADIPEEYKGYISAASILGVTKGAYTDEGEVCFYPNNQITRAEAAVMINRLYNFDENGTVAVSSFNDSDSIPVWAVPSVSALVSAGIINGNADGSISPYSGLTRAEAAVMLSKVA